MKLHIACPHCEQPAYGTHKRQLTQLVTQLTYVCRNPHCGAAFIFQGEVLRQLRLPSRPNPKVNVPLSPVIQRRALIDALENLPTDDSGPEDETFPPSKEQLDIFRDGVIPHGP